ncbi:MAG: c-type cytochrome [Planctomycetales bacterium]|nr:c-type cytochrome [Planctomycetales bacterium]
MDDVDDGELDRFRPGLTAEYSDGGQDFQLVCATATVDPTYPSTSHSRLTIRWTGLLFVRYAGRFHIEPFGCGKAIVHLNGKRLLSETTMEPQWYSPGVVELDYGWHPIEVVYESGEREKRFGLYWSSDQFLTEPITAWFHDPDSLSDVARPSKSLSVGRSLVADLRCASCHEFPQAANSLAAPLDHLPENLNRDWLVDYLSSGVHGGEGRAPKLDITRQDARDIATSLFDGVTSQNSEETRKGNNTKGAELFHSVGCLACHAYKGIGNATTGGGDLTELGQKRTREFIAKWLTDPAQINPNHQMPQFDLSAEQIRDLASFLIQTVPEPRRDNTLAGSAERGEQLIAKHHCAACHAVPVAQSVAVNIRIDSTSDWQESCINDPAETQPDYELSEPDRESIKAFLSHAATQDVPIDGMALIKKHNCLSCHDRGENVGLRDTIEAAIDRHGSLNPHISAMAPPSLNSVGDKLNDQAIRSVIEQSHRARRPWKKVQMPKFNLSGPELDAIEAFFVREDRVPAKPLSDQRADSPTAAEQTVAGSRLVTSDGFGCTSCHAIGNTQPNEAPVHLLGPDLSMVGNRVRQQWFRRWLKNPANIVARVEMPSVQRPVHGVLHDNLAHQIDATWHVLNTADFSPPQPNALRVVRHTGDGSSRAHVLTDVMRYNDDVLIKPFAIGLPNRNNVLVDLDDGKLLDWSVGDVARQRTKGKTWFWEWAGQQLLGNERDGASDFQLVIGSEMVDPQRVGQFTSEPHQWIHKPNGLFLKRVLRFPLNGQTVYVWVSEEFKQIEKGIVRSVEVTKLPENASLHLRIVDSTMKTTTSSNTISWTSKAGIEAKAVVTGRDGTRGSAHQDGAVLLHSGHSTIKADVVYSTEINADTFPSLASVIGKSPSADINPVPGFDAIRLPNDHEAMPTGFAWRSDGTMFVTSLKGRVWTIVDTDGDGVEDTSSVFSDELAAPFGVVAHDDYIDVINKTGLLRLFDQDNDGQADVTQTIASGWGHTADYHDWAVGLPTDSGDYFASIACQQDDRSEAAARLRGKVVRITPRAPSDDNPHLYSISELSGGHRFAIGIAQSRSGDLYVSDNQGNFNPYNELNHVRPGLRFGFINKLENGSVVNPPLANPSINIPHPWTRSVNGICFLDTPVSEPSNKRESAFGPFEGHIVGCEYDTRRLVRMSVQCVGDTFQGAVYPFSYTNPGEDNPLLGPVACAVSPRGELYIGEMRDSGWGAGNNTGEIVRLTYNAKQLPCGIAEIRAIERGFEIEFTKPIDPAKAQDPNNYGLSSATRVSTPAYGGDDRDRRRENIERIEVVNTKDANLVRLYLSELRTGYVYDFHISSLATDGELFFPAEAYYSLNELIHTAPR